MSTTRRSLLPNHHFKEGARVAAIGRNQASLDSLIEAITSDGGEAVAINCDITDDGAVARTVEQTVEHFGSLSILVNNAGVLQGGAVGVATMANWYCRETPLSREIYQLYPQTNFRTLDRA